MASKFNKMMCNLAEYLENQRIKKDITQAEFASEIGMSLATYRRVIVDPEKFCPGMGIEKFERFAAIEGRSLSEFLIFLEGKRAKSNCALSKTETNIINALQEIFTPEELEEICSIYACDKAVAAEGECTKERRLYHLIYLFFEMGEADQLTIELKMLEAYLRRGNNCKHTDYYQKRTLSIVRKKFVRALNMDSRNLGR